MWRFCLRWADPLLAVALTAGSGRRLAAEGQLGDLPGSICVLGFCALVAVRRRRPCRRRRRSPASSSPSPIAGDASTVNANATFVSGWAAVFLYSYALGADAAVSPLARRPRRPPRGGQSLRRRMEPVPEMLALGPYAAGLAVASRRRASAELEVRARELEEEREIFAEQSVRYERARIARELHDIVAHSVSLMVVQANAGERLATVDPASAAEAFTSISDAAQQAEAEIDRLVNCSTTPCPIPRRRAAHRRETVARAHASGLAITCQLSGDIDDLPARRRRRLPHGPGGHHERHEARPRGAHRGDHPRRRQRGRGLGDQRPAAAAARQA